MQKAENDRSEGRAPSHPLHAGLLWSLVGRDGRRTLARSLTLAEILALNDAARIYREAGEAAKRAVAADVRLLLRNEQGRGPVVFTGILLLGTAVCIASYVQFFPRRSIEMVLSLFSPLVVAALAPLSLRLLSQVRRRQLFHPNLSPTQFLYVVPSFVALVWLLFWVNGDAAPARLPALELGLLLLAGLFGPVFEEVVFREIIPGAAGRSSPWFGHVLSALLFALMHLPGSGAQFLYFVLAAATLSLLRILSGGLFWPVVVHGMANAVSLLILSA